MVGTKVEEMVLQGKTTEFMIQFLVLSLSLSLSIIQGVKQGFTLIVSAVNLRYRFTLPFKTGSMRWLIIDSTYLHAVGRAFS